VKVSWVIASALLLTPATAAAQTSLQIPLQFDFLNPGAKSLALAGAFSGLADDATATFANPAGLLQLGSSEVSIELRGTHTNTQFLQAGRLSGQITNQGTDTIQGPFFGDIEGSHTGVGFLAAVYSPPSRRWVIAGYRHELVRVDQSFLSNGVFQIDAPTGVSFRDRPQQGVREVSITGYGVSGAYKLGPLVSIGGSITAYDFDMNTVFRRFLTDGFFGPPDLSKEVSRGTQSGNDVSWAPTIGVLIGRESTRFGVVYRRGASFDFTTVEDNSPARTSVFRVPDTLAFGGSFRVRPPLLAAFEVTYVRYSRLREDFVTDQALAVGHADNFTIDDGVEVHGGVQYAVTRWRFIPRFRGGAWFDPDHSVHFTPTGDASFDERLSTALSTGKNQVHGTGGVGLTFGSHFELNAGFDISSTTKIFSTSLILR
jgi:long-subunit fatty acid transport protein